MRLFCGSPEAGIYTLLLFPQHLEIFSGSQFWQYHDHNKISYWLLHIRVLSQALYYEEK